MYNAYMTIFSNLNIQNVYTVNIVAIRFDHMKKSGFRTISLPKSYYDNIVEYIDQSQGAYVSVAEVIREALRDYFRNR